MVPSHCHQLLTQTCLVGYYWTRERHLLSRFLKATGTPWKSLESRSCPRCGLPLRVRGAQGVREVFPGKYAPLTFRISPTSPLGRALRTLPLWDHCPCLPGLRMPLQPRPSVLTPSSEASVGPSSAETSISRVLPVPPGASVPPFGKVPFSCTASSNVHRHHSCCRSEACCLVGAKWVSSAPWPG